MLERIELLTFYAKAYKLSYRSAGLNSPWKLFEEDAAWTSLPSGLGNALTVTIGDELRERMGVVEALRMDVINAGKKITSFCGVNVFGWC